MQNEALCAQISTKCFLYHIAHFVRLKTLYIDKWTWFRPKKGPKALVLCMGAQASIVPEPFSWLSRVASFAQRGEPIPPISISRVAMNQSHACGLGKVFIGTYLSFREVKPRVRKSGCLNTQGSEAVLKVQLQRRAGKNHVWSNRQSRVRLEMVRLHNTCTLRLNRR